jgi:hypothetical protein
MASAWDSTPVAPVAASAPAKGNSAWDATPAAAPATAAAPRGFLGNAGDFLDAASHHVMKFVDGTGQLVEHGIAGAANLLPDNPVSRAIARQNAADDLQSTQWEQAYQKRVPDGPWATAGAATGELAPFVLEAPGKALKFIGEGAEKLASRYLPSSVAKVGGKAAAGTATGAAMGLVQPVTNQVSLQDLVDTDTPGQNDYWTQKAEQAGIGALSGGSLSGLGAGAGALYGKASGALQAAVNPTKYAAGQIRAQLGSQVPSVVSDLKSAPTYVPGSIPTAAQAAGTPQLVMMEKALNNNNKDFAAALLKRQNANNAARLATVGDVAKTPADLAAAVADRTRVTAPMRDFTVTNGNPVPVDGIQGALSSLENGSLGVRPTIGGAASSMRSAVNDFTNVTPPNTLTNTPGSATANPAMLDALRQNANDYLSKFAPNGVVGTQEQAAMMPVKSAIVDAIDAANPGHKLSNGGWGKGFEQAGPVAPSYRDYLAEFANRSVPINTMEAGQQLQAKLLAGSLNSAGDAAATLPGYRSALAQALRDSPYGIDPKAQAALEGVQSDLQRATISNSVRTPGSDTAFNQGAGKAFLRAMGASDGSSVPAALAATGTGLVTGSPMAAYGAAMGAKNAGGWLANRVGEATGKLLLDPQLLAAELSAQGTPITMPALASRLGNPALAAALLLQLQQQHAPEKVAQ